MCVCVYTCDVVMVNLPIVLVMIVLELVAAIDDTGEVLVTVV